MYFSIKITLFLSAVGLFSIHAQNLKFEQKEDGILLLDNNAPRYFYRSTALKQQKFYGRAHYVHPLYDDDGKIITEDFPADHPHHHGIFWAWHQLYIDKKRVADPWLNENIVWSVKATNTKIEDDRAVLTTMVNWIAKDIAKAVMAEKTTISFHRISDSVFSIDFRVELTALKNGIQLGGSEDVKGYGGFSARLKLPENVLFYSENGHVKPQNTAIKAGPWIDISSASDSYKNELTEVVLMGEPEKLPQYQGWILRAENSMQNMAFPGAVPITIKKGKTLHFRNRILVHKGLKTEQIGHFYDQFRDLEKKD